MLPELSKDPSYQYFRVTGLIGTVTVDDSKLLGRLSSTLDPRNVVRLQKRPQIIQYLVFDASVTSHFQRSEEISNQINQYLLSQPEAQDLARVLEQNRHHGWGHLRRVEKWAKMIDANDPELRVNPHYLYFQLSKYCAIRSHDLAQAYVTKDNHAEVSALFEWLFLLQASDYIKKISGSERVTAGIPEADIAKLAAGAGFINLHHSVPEKTMPEVDELVHTGLFDPQELLRIVEKTATSLGKKDIYDFFPPFALVADKIKVADRGELKPVRLAAEELQGLKLQTLAMSAADKLDAMFPTDYAAGRMVQTKPHRPIFVRLSGLTLEDEFRLRVEDGSGNHGQDDLSRILFEVARVDPFSGFSVWVDRMYTIGLWQKAAFFQRAIPALLMKDVLPYEAMFARLEQNEFFWYLRRIGVEEPRARFLVYSSVERNYISRIAKEIEAHGYDARALLSIKYIVDEDRDVVMGAIDHKLELLDQEGITANDQRRATDLMNLALAVQRSIVKPAGPLVFEYPFSYFPLNLSDWVATPA